jgi:hypothetical protein
MIQAHRVILKVRKTNVPVVNWVEDPHNFNEDPDLTFYFNADPDPALQYTAHRVILMIRKKKSLESLHPSRNKVTTVPTSYAQWCSRVSAPTYTFRDDLPEQ